MHCAVRLMFYGFHKFFSIECTKRQLKPTKAHTIPTKQTQKISKAMSASLSEYSSASTQ